MNGGAQLEQGNTMKYLCLICAEKVMEQMPAADAEKHYREYEAFMEEIRKSVV